ncbi:membrane or secreted protein [Robertkochia solimangrovi]|uniref:membrane or secreted protein n=1 Tax=Robertkochia solimangrovi TaxID=2213046 RepID=UPI00117E3817|nr:membrane or secreted protein [Robertkochia solimangrovi]TRZ43192.1 membrane or secreted protein [Robertkochia solimangrovi]
MKVNTVIFLFFLFSTPLYSQSPIGGWEGKITLPSGEPARIFVIITDHYQSATWFKAETGEFLMTNGGTWSIDGNTMTETVEYDSANPDRVGSSVTFEIELTEKTFRITGSEMKLERIDSGTESPLAGAWLISGRKQGEEIAYRDTDRPRKTMKILSGKLFQWTAYNTETHEFMGTGGGMYSAENGIYTEEILYFSRNNARVGAKLEFNFELIDGNWHHSGKSSKGDPIYEVWIKRPQ